MGNFVIVLILIICVGGACYSIYKNKKKGAECISCPYAKSCGGGCGGDALESEEK